MNKFVNNLKINIKQFTWQHLFLMMLFILYIYLNFLGLSVKELQGDESSPLLAVIPAMKFYDNPLWLSSIFLFNHVPLRGLVEIPFLYLFGLKEFWLYFPNVLANLALFWAIWFLLISYFNKRTALIGVSLLAVNGGIIIQRMIMGVGFFLLFTTLMLNYFYLFLKNKEIKYFKRVLICLFLAILTYEEALIFIPVIIYWLWQRHLLGKKEVVKNLIIFFWSIAIFLLFWFFIPLIADRFHYLDNLRDTGLIRLLIRSVNGFSPNIFYLPQLLKSYNSQMMTGYILIGLFLSLFIKTGRYFWSFLFPPLIYFSIIKNPTIHLYNYLNLIFILASLGWNNFLCFLKLRCQSAFFFKISFYLLLVLAIYQNLSYLRNQLYVLNPLNNYLSWGAIFHKGIKSTAYMVRNNTGICDRIYTDMEGYVFRLYFGRRYTRNILEAKFIVLEKDLADNEYYQQQFDAQYASFKNFMPYLKCPN